MTLIRELVYAALDAIVMIAVVLPCLYLAGLAFVSWLPPRRFRRRRVDPIQLAVLIPAHNEERSIGRTIASIVRAAPDAAVHVVADNCSDATAAKARSAGACVHSRGDQSRRGKAAALNWLVREVLAEDAASHAFVIVDADSRVQPEFFEQLRGRLAEGAMVVQAANLADREVRAPLALLRRVAFHLRCELRPRAYERLGASAGLYGNGMCFAREVLERYPWNERSVVEDHELHVRLVASGITVRFAARAVVRSTMPASFRGAAKQAIRWESATAADLAEGFTLVWRGARHRRITELVAGLEVVIPLLSLLVASGVAALLTGVALADLTLTALGGLALVSSTAYVARGIALARIGPRELLFFALWIPAFVIWKLGILIRAIAGAGRSWEQARERPAVPGR